MVNPVGKLSYSPGQTLYMNANNRHISKLNIQVTSLLHGVIETILVSKANKCEKEQHSNNMYTFRIYK